MSLMTVLVFVKAMAYFRGGREVTLEDVRQILPFVLHDKLMQDADAETTPIRDPWAYQYDIDVADVAEVWRRGSVISSWLIDLTAEAFARTPDLHTFAGRVSDSGEGRWTVDAAIDEGVPAPVITMALYERFESRGLGEFTGKILSAMRSEFGGHAERKQ